MEEEAHALLDINPTLGRFDLIPIDVAAMAKPQFLPIRSLDVDRRAYHAAYSMVAAVLRRLQKQGSYDGLFQVLNDDLRDYSPAVVLGIPGSAFTLEKADIPEGFKLRVVICDDEMAMAGAEIWSLQSIRDVPLGIREVSLGELRQLNEAGSFGGYFSKKGSLGATTRVDSAAIGVTYSFPSGANGKGQGTYNVTQHP